MLYMSGYTDDVIVRLPSGLETQLGPTWPDGADIRFDDAAGKPLPYEIEKWDAGAKQAALWVRTDVKGNNATQSITLKWGNPEASTESNGAAVFPTLVSLTPVRETLEDFFMRQVSAAGSR